MVDLLGFPRHKMEAAYLYLSQAAHVMSSQQTMSCLLKSSSPWQANERTLAKYHPEGHCAEPVAVDTASATACIGAVPSGSRGGSAGLLLGSGPGTHHRKSRDIR
jgi:hypothetical protein